MMMNCPKCNAPTRMQVQAVISAPGELAHGLSKRNLRRKDVYLMGVLWETADYICTNEACRCVVDGFGNYVTNLKKENERLRAERDRAAPTLPSVPAGWQLVPVEPTDEMIYAATSEMIYKTEPHTLRIWYAMLAAAPKPEE